MGDKKPRRGGRAGVFVFVLFLYSTPASPVSIGWLMYSRGSVIWPVRALAATVRGLARKTLLLIEPMRPGKLRLVVLTQTSEWLRRPKVSAGPPRQAEQPEAPILQPASRNTSSIDFS